MVSIAHPGIPFSTRTSPTNSLAFEVSISVTDAFMACTQMIFLSGTGVIYLQGLSFGLSCQMIMVSSSIPDQFMVDDSDSVATRLRFLGQWTVRMSAIQ